MIVAERDANTSLLASRLSVGTDNSEVGVLATAAEAFGRNEALTAVTERPSSLSGVRSIVDVVFSYTNRNTDVTEKFFVRVDVTEEFPFLVTKMSPLSKRSVYDAYSNMVQMCDCLYTRLPKVQSRFWEV